MYLSYLMGAQKISDGDLDQFGVEIQDRTDGGSRMLRVPAENLSSYLELVKEKLDPGFWNEVIGESEIIFVFKFKDGNLKEFKLSIENESEIDKLCADFNNEPADKTSNVYKYLSENDFYHDFMLKRYSGLINRPRVK